MSTILIVDDCSIDRRLIGGLLCCVPTWQVQFACDGREAWERIRRQRPDAVVTDLQMPEMDGLELVRAVKRDFPGLPVILITSQGSQEIALTALREGAAHYSPKRYLARDLVPTLRHVLGIAQRIQSHDPDQRLDSGGPPVPGGVLVPPTTVDGSAWRVAFELENDDRLIGRLIEYLQGNLPAWAEPDSIQVAMALHEAITNAMHHGNLEVSSCMREHCEVEYVQTIRERRGQPPFADRRVRITAHFLKEEIRFEVADQGPGFDPCSVADPTTSENLEKLSGRGLLLIRSFMDQVRHNEQGNQITMIKWKPGIGGHPL